MELVRIKAGSFMMGSKQSVEDLCKRFDTQALWFDGEHPRHQVTLTAAFYMGVTEVTQGQFEAVMGTRPWEGRRRSRTWGKADVAADYISWDAATAFCAALSKKTGRTVRLPTEAEWEYACRAGTTTLYSFGDDPSELGDYAWYYANVQSAGQGLRPARGQEEA